MHVCQFTGYTISYTHADTGGVTVSVGGQLL